MRNKDFQLRFIIGLGLLLISLASNAIAYPLTAEQKERLKTYLPRTAYKMERHDPVHIVATGDSVTWMFSLDKKISGDFLQSYASVFAGELAKEFFYPGGVRVVNPVEGHEQKRDEKLGAEVWIENMATPGATTIDAMRRFTTEVFLNQPDLVMINYGINDAIRNMSLGLYRQTLQRMVDLCKENGSDVVIFAPNPIKESSGQLPWGLSRPFASVAKEVAQEKGVFFADLGQLAIDNVGGVGQEFEPVVAMGTVSDRLSEMFDVSAEGEERLHPNPGMQSALGKAAFHLLIEGDDQPVFSIKSTVEYESEDTINVTSVLRNQSNQPHAGHLAALTIGKQFVPTDPFRQFELEPGAKLQMVFVYKREAEGSEDDKMIYYPTEISESNLRLSFIVSDSEKTRFIDEVRRLEPIGVIWRSQFLTDITNVIPLEWNFVNGADTSVNGTYTISLGDQKAEETNFTLPPLGAKKFMAQFPFQPSATAARMKNPVTLKVKADGKSFTFRRELEAVRDFGLGQKVALAQEEAYREHSGEMSGTLSKGQPGVTVRADADAQFLFLTYDISNIDLQSISTGQSIITDVQLDARPSTKRKERGFAGKIRVSAAAADGPGTTDRLLPGMLGEGYAFAFDPAGIASALRRETPTSKRFEVRIPRNYLVYHEWNLGSPTSTLGFNTTISFAELNPETNGPAFPATRRYAHARSDLYFSDSWSLGQLKLTRDPVKTWTVRLD